MQCRIRINGHLDASWQEWLEGLQITHEPAGTTLCSGPLQDQAALYGVLLSSSDRKRVAEGRQAGFPVLCLEKDPAGHFRDLWAYRERSPCDVLSIHSNRGCFDTKRKARKEQR